MWLWLSGAFVSALNDPAAGFGQTRMLLDEILDEGAVGTLQEIRDGAAAASNDEFGGATSQAWSLAELLRNAVQDYAGLQVDLTATPPLIQIAPHLPETWPQLAVRTRIGTAPCLLTVSGEKGDPTIELSFSGEPGGDWEYRLVLPGKEPRTGRIRPDGTDRWTVAWD